MCVAMVELVESQVHGGADGGDLHVIQHCTVPQVPGCTVRQGPLIARAHLKMDKGGYSPSIQSYMTVLSSTVECMIQHASIST